MSGGQDAGGAVSRGGARQGGNTGRGSVVLARPDEDSIAGACVRHPYTAVVSTLDDAPLVHADEPATWRAWLEANHATARGVWVVTWRSGSGRVRLGYEESVEEALCFGWVDSTGGKVDEERGKLYFAPRKPRSVWAASNRARVERLIREGRMAPAGFAAIERARANGSWETMDSVERLELPEDLAAALEIRPPAATNFAGFPASARKMLLAWVALAQRPATRAARIAEIAEAAARNERARG